MTCYPAEKDFGEKLKMQIKIKYYSHCCDADMDGPVLTTTAGVSVCGVCRRCKEYTTFDMVAEEAEDE